MVPDFGGWQRVTPGLAGVFLIAGLSTLALPGMGSFLSVARGSEEPPRFIVLRYDGAAKSEAPVVLVGIFAIGFSGLVIDSLLRSIERRSVPWIGKV